MIALEYGHHNTPPVIIAWRLHFRAKSLFSSYQWLPIPTESNYRESVVVLCHSGQDLSLEYGGFVVRRVILKERGLCPSRRGSLSEEYGMGVECGRGVNKSVYFVVSTIHHCRDVCSGHWAEWGAI